MDQKSLARDNASQQDDSAGNVGAEIRRLRKIRKLTLEAMSQATGLSVGYLSQVERDKSSPTVKAMFDISQALGVTINWFFHEGGRDERDEDLFVVRAGRRRSIRYDTGIVDELLNTQAVKSFEFLMSTFPPGSNFQESPYSHEGEECGVVIQGQLQLQIDGIDYILNKGDSFSFPSSLKHRYSNLGDEQTRVIWCTSPPTY